MSAEVSGDVWATPPRSNRRWPHLTRARAGGLRACERCAPEFPTSPRKTKNPELLAVSGGLPGAKPLYHAETTAVEVHLAILKNAVSNS
uniref:Uncharacterized protein n=1 Tax=Knipowitschia caucasica TaxID=637954 RepID=A0AAV2L8V5_KNICA